jgi:hypothetical protein
MLAREGVMEDSVETRAINLVVGYYESRDWEVTNVSRARGDHGGYDLLVQRGSERLNVEVKGCTRRYGIPDPYITEFDPESRRLIADILCVVYFWCDPPQLAIIPRDAIPPEYVVPKFGYRISGKFKNARTIDKFLVEV